jgi:hypothetical protein
MSSMSSLEFNQDAGKARLLAENEPVFILDRGSASHVLLSIGEYRKLAGHTQRPSDVLARDAELDFDPSKTNDGDFRTVEFD